MQEGWIIANISNQYQVETQKEVVYQCIARGKLKQKEITPVVGDKVEIEIVEEGKKGTIESILPRKNYCKRPKIANITQLVLVLSTNSPKPDINMLDRQLVFAEHLGIPSLIVINKVDLKEEEEIVKQYEKIGYPVLTTIAKENKGIPELRQKLQGKISAFSGNSGVGKSTLLNALFQKELTQEGEISKKNQKGKNTTTAVQLYKLEKDTYVADTPGFSTFELTEIKKEMLAKYFIDFLPYIQECAFVGCTHVKEEECGIRKALQEGKITQSRYQNYVTIYQELKKKEEYKW